MGEQRMTEAMTKMVQAYRNGMELSENVTKVFGDDGGLSDVPGLIQDGLILMCGEIGTYWEDTLVHKLLKSNMRDKVAGKILASLAEKASKEKERTKA